MLSSEKKYLKLVNKEIWSKIKSWDILYKDKKNIFKIIDNVNKNYLFFYHLSLSSVYELTFNKNIDNYLLNLISEYIIFEGLNFNLFFYKSFFSNRIIKKRNRILSLFLNDDNSILKTSLDNLKSKSFSNNSIIKKEKIAKVIENFFVNLEQKDPEVYNKFKNEVVFGVGFFFNLIFNDVDKKMHDNWLLFFASYFTLVLIHNNYYYYFVNKKQKTGLILLENEYQICKIILNLLKNLQESCKIIFKMKFNLVLRIVNKNFRLI